MWPQHLLAYRATVLPPTASVTILGGPLCRDFTHGQGACVSGWQLICQIGLKDQEELCLMTIATAYPFTPSVYLRTGAERRSYLHSTCVVVCPGSSENQWALQARKQAQRL